MTAKEKAKELVEKMDLLDVYSKRQQDERLAKKLSKQCALIAVDEILNIDDESYYNYNREYWQQVKEEIEQL